MAEFDLHSITFIHPAASTGSDHHLLVLVPAHIDSRGATRRIWELAQTTGLPVQLLGLCTDPAEESELRRELVTLASLLQGGEISVEVKVEFGTGWLNAVRNSYQPGDLIVCPAGQRSGLLRKSLNQILEANFKATVYLLSDPAPYSSKLSRLSQLGAWLGCLGILIAFSLLQIKIIQFPEGWLQTTLLILSVLTEFRLIWILDRQFE